MGWLFDVLGISVDGFVSSIFNGIINWIYEVIFSVIKVVFTNVSYFVCYGSPAYS